MNEKEKDILKHGKMSQYWEEYVDSLPWGNESAETKLYVAGILKGFSHETVLQVMNEQSNLHGSDFQNMGFFIWTEFFDNLK